MGCRTRARDAEVTEAERDKEKEAELLAALAGAQDTSRHEALGYDRHWNRYWLLGAWAGPGAGGAPPSSRCCWLC